MQTQRLMKERVDSFRQQLTGLRAGRASPHILDNIQVYVHGMQLMLPHVASVSISGNQLLVQVWDSSQTQAVEKAIRQSQLGLNPQTQGSTIRVPLPAVSEERRAELVRTASSYAEASRVAVRQLRKDALHEIRDAKTLGKISEASHNRQAKDIQQWTDDAVKAIDDALAAKSKEIMTI